MCARYLQHDRSALRCIGSEPVLTGVLEEDQKAKLRSVSGQTDEEHGIASDDKGQAVVTGVPLS